MTDIQLLCVTELLSQFGDQVVKIERDEADFQIHLSDDRSIRICFNGNKFWYLNGQRHRTDGPAIEWADGDKEWYLNDQSHRTDGPAVERVSGDRFWHLSGQLHRTDGPAAEWVSGDRFWYLNGQRHRTDGPAVEWANGDKERWLHGVEQTDLCNRLRNLV